MSISPPKSVLKPAAAKYLCSSSLSQSHYHLLLRFLQAILTSGPTSTPAPNPRFPTGCSLPVFLLPSVCFHLVLSCRTVEHSEHPPPGHFCAFVPAQRYLGSNTFMSFDL
ncbi:unnamed protein product [Rangifer tarandus platyrhynchus]|uniref:Uncharacterized protein n=1 Tax=Rangifer tarandus platyrhynchus TaxID=3082113 RepID=A0ABN8XUZ3_RANTA|nr:unnamed protein product [Rangifer tarandus platyrhynchus]